MQGYILAEHQFLRKIFFEILISMDNVAELQVGSEETVKISKKVSELTRKDVKESTEKIYYNKSYDTVITFHSWSENCICLI